MQKARRMGLSVRSRPAGPRPIPHQTRGRFPRFVGVRYFPGQPTRPDEIVRDSRNRPMGGARWRMTQWAHNRNERAPKGVVYGVIAGDQAEHRLEKNLCVMEPKHKRNRIG